MKYKIQKNISLPDRQRRGTKDILDILDEMTIGDSVVVPRSQRDRWTSASYRHQIKIITRSISDTEIRVWKAE